MSVLKTDREYLVDAAGYIEKYGWRQKWPGGHGLPACLLGAVGYAMQGAPQGEEKSIAYKRIVKLLRDGIAAPAEYALSSDSRIVTAWNDVRGRKKDEVVALLLGAAGELAGIAPPNSTTTPPMETP